MYPNEKKTLEMAMTHLGPYRSYNFPETMMEKAEKIMLRKKAREIEPRFQPNAAIIGLNNTPKELRAPELKKKIVKEEAKMYQP
jgi:23S rRNA pseudoU1915 N3-methylase RlmH